MPTKEKLIRQIDHALDAYNLLKARSSYDDCGDLPTADSVALINTLISTIQLSAPVQSSYYKNCVACTAENRADNPYNIPILVGILKSLREFYEQGNLVSVAELIHADVFTDFIEMAEYLLSEGYKDAAAVIMGGVLEGHICKLCENNSLPTKENNKRIKADRLNAELAKADVYGILDQKSVTQWLDLRNHAAHGEYDVYTKEQVALMIQGITEFMSRYPA